MCLVKRTRLRAQAVLCFAQGDSRKGDECSIRAAVDEVGQYFSDFLNHFKNGAAPPVGCYPAFLVRSPDNPDGLLRHPDLLDLQVQFQEAGFRPDAKITRGALVVSFLPLPTLNRRVA